MSSKARKLTIQQARVFRTVEDTPTLLNLLGIATSAPQKANFIETLLQNMPDAFLSSDKQPDDLFALFTAWFGSFNNSNTIFSGISAALKLREQNLLEHRFKKREFMRDIGLDWGEDAKSFYFSNVNSAYDVFGKYSFPS